MRPRRSSSVNGRDTLSQTASVGSDGARTTTLAVYGEVAGCFGGLIEAPGCHAGKVGAHGFTR